MKSQENPMQKYIQYFYKDVEPYHALRFCARQYI